MMQLRNQSGANISSQSQVGKGLVIADLPKAGLGNKLFVWAKAHLFAHNHGLPLYIKGLNQISIGAFLRKERAKRFYFGQFQFQSKVGITDYYLRKVAGKYAVQEADGDVHLKNGDYNYLFTEIPHWQNRFEGINDCREVIITGMHNLLSARIKKVLAEDNCKPVIGMHIRLGDFKKLQPGTNFKNVGGIRTPLDYFEQCIHSIRSYSVKELPVTIFSDGYPSELRQILKMPGVTLAPVAPDVVDMIRLSRSQYIFTSAGSTFGEWAGYLSSAPVFIHPDHIHGRIRDPKYGYYEGSLEDYLQD
jgi:hypothetical protein